MHALRSRATRSFVFAAAAGLCLAATVATPAFAAWKFAVPDGWTDLSPGQPVPEEVPEALATMVQSGVYTAYAIDMKGAKDGFSRERLASSHPGPSSAIVVRARAGSMYSPVALDTSTVARKRSASRFVRKPRLSVCL